MARASLKPIPLAKNTTLTPGEDGYVVKGPKGSVNVPFVPGIEIKVEGEEVKLSFASEPGDRAMLGLAVALVTNAINGVTEGFKKVLTVRGIGYKVALNGRKLNLNLGFTHPIEFTLPDGIEAEIFEPKSRDDKDWIADITIKGVDKQLVGQIAANIRRVRPPEPYKGKGVRYKDEYFRRKLGKRAVGAE